MLRERFKKLRPHLKDSTIGTYVSSIRRLKKIDKNLDYAPISNYIRQLPVNIGVSILSALIVLEGRHRFGRLYDGLIDDASKLRGQQRFTKTELQNWSSSKEIREGIRRIKFDVDRMDLLSRPRSMKPSEFAVLQQYLVLRFYSEFHFRSDLVSIRLGKHIGQNYLYGGKIYLNKFKTADKFAAQQKLPLTYTPSRGLGTLLRKFIDIRERQDIIYS